MCGPRSPICPSHESLHQDGEVEEDGEGQVEVEREEGEVNEVRLKNTLSHEGV